jgi:hypothetical protein
MIACGHNQNTDRNPELACLNAEQMGLGTCQHAVVVFRVQENNRVPVCSEFGNRIQNPHVLAHMAKMGLENTTSVW